MIKSSVLLLDRKRGDDIEDLWFFSNCDTCQAYSKDENIKDFSDNNACEKFFSCLNRDKCNKERQASLVKERRDKLDKIIQEHPYDEFRKHVINKVKTYLKIIDVREVIDPYNYSNCKYILKMPLDFHYSICFEILDDYHTIYDWTEEDVGEKLVENIRQAFLDVTINKK